MYKYQRFIIVLIAAAIFSIFHINTIFAEPVDSSIKVILDGKPLSFDVPPVTINGRTMVPVRKIFESLGASVDWEGSTKTVIGNLSTSGVVTTVLLRQYDNNAFVSKEYNGETVLSNKQITLDAPATPVNGRTMVPLRFVAESLGAGVDWENTTKTVFITSSKDTPVPVNTAGDLYSAIKSGLQDNKEFIFLSFGQSGPSFTREEISNTIVQVTGDHPEFDYLQSYSVGDSIIEFDYNFPMEKVRAMRKMADDRVNEIVRTVIKPGFSELQKESALHDYLVNHTTYDYDNYLKNTLPHEDYTAYGVLINGTGVCQGYTAAINLLLQP